MSATAEAWDERLRARGYRITPQRQLVLEAVTRLGHGTPEEILTEVQRQSSSVNLSTVYRTLEVLEEVGLITHLHIGHGSPTYHAAEEDVHIHLVCRSCDSVEGIPASVAKPFVDALDRERGFSTDLGHMTVQGTCTKCRS